MRGLNLSMKSSLLKIDETLSEYALTGSGGPILVLESGLGDALGVWNAFIKEVNGVTKTFAYNRAGYGKSTSTQKERDGFAIVEELDSLLCALGFEPPYVLVGHSLGGAFMEIFAQKHPEKVRGLVLIDPMGIEMDELCEVGGLTEWNRPPLFKKLIASILMPRGAKQELGMREKTLAQARIALACSNRFPVAIISAGKSMWSNRLQDAWLRSHSLMAKRYSHCCHIVEEHSSHYIQIDNPGFIAAQILKQWFSP